MMSFSVAGTSKEHICEQQRKENLVMHDLQHIFHVITLIFFSFGLFSITWTMHTI